MEKWKEKTIKEKIKYIISIILQIVITYCLLRVIVISVVNFDEIVNETIIIQESTFYKIYLNAFALSTIVIIMQNWIHVIEIIRSSKLKEAIYMTLENIVIICCIFFSNGPITFTVSILWAAIIMLMDSLDNQTKRLYFMRLSILIFFILYFIAIVIRLI